MNASYNYDIINDYMDENYQEDGSMIKSLNEINIYDLGGIDHYVVLRKNKKFGFDLEIENEEDQTIFKESGVHPHAIDSLALFCRRFLNSYDHALDKE